MAEKIVRICNQQIKPVKLIKWKVHAGVSVPIGRILLLYDFVDSSQAQNKKLKTTTAGVVHKLMAKEGDILKKGDVLLEIEPCSHPTIVNDMCAECGADLRKDDITGTASVPMVHTIPDLKVSEELAQKLGKADNERLIRDRKLVLLVDLDQTLIHTTNDNIPPNIKDVYHFQLYGPTSPWYHTRLRPQTHQFLHNIHKFYELHICTFGARNYAHTIAMFLDADQKIFSNRILSRDECFDPTSKKANLKALFPCGDNMVCIIDDREDVWSHASNLIHVKPYHFFQHTGDINAPPGLEKHEEDDKVGVDLSKLIHKNNKSDINKPQDENGDEFVNSNIKKIDINSDKDVEKNSEELEGNAEKIHNQGSVINKGKKEQIDFQVQTRGITRNGNLIILVGDDREMNGVSLNNSTSEKNLQKSDGNGNRSGENENGGDSTNSCKPDNAKELEEVKNKANEIVSNIDNDKNDIVEVEDPDDYLIYLEDILAKIHSKFYQEYDEMESGEIPDLKKVIPKVRRQILKKCKIAFSGLVPTRTKLEHSKAYQVAKSLGAVVTQDLEHETTHLVAVRPGTVKVNAGKKKKNLKIVNPDWLWSCAERWEHVDERLFPLKRKGSKNRHPPPHCSSPQHIPEYPEHNTPAARKRTPSGRFMDTINPLMSFSSDEIANMDKEVEASLDNESDTSDQEGEDDFIGSRNGEISPIAEILNDGVSSSSSDDSLSGDYPKGFKRKRRDGEGDININDDFYNSTEDESPSVKFRRGENLDIDMLDMEPDETQDSEGSLDPPDEVDDGEWNMMGAALEREFLANN